MELLCTNNCGASSLHCHNTKCKYSNQKHKLCRVIRFKGLAELLERRFDSFKTFLQRIEEVEEDFIENLRKEREQTYRKILFREFENE
jgi:hypothetical protein